MEVSEEELEQSDPRQYELVMLIAEYKVLCNQTFSDAGRFRSKVYCQTSYASMAMILVSFFVPDNVRVILVILALPASLLALVAQFIEGVLFRRSIKVIEKMQHEIETRFEALRQEKVKALYGS